MEATCRIFRFKSFLFRELEEVNVEMLYGLGMCFGTIFKKFGWKSYESRFVS